MTSYCAFIHSEDSEPELAAEIYANLSRKERQSMEIEIENELGAYYAQVGMEAGVYVPTITSIMLPIEAFQLRGR